MAEGLSPRLPPCTRTRARNAKKPGIAAWLFAVLVPKVGLGSRWAERSNTLILHTTDRDVESSWHSRTAQHLIAAAFQRTSQKFAIRFSLCDASHIVGEYFIDCLLQAAISTSNTLNFIR